MTAPRVAACRPDVEEDRVKITIDNTEGIRHAALILEPGVNVLRGANGKGKTSAMRAATRLAGGDVPLAPYDGAAQGTVEGLGVRLVVRKVVRTTGTADLALADTAPLGDLIDPGIKDSEKANSARLRALARLSRLPVTDDAVRALAADDEVAKAALEAVRQACIGDLLQASEVVRLAAHRIKRGQEQDALSAGATAQAAEIESGKALGELGGEHALTATLPAEADARERELSRRHAEADYQMRQRAEMERRQAEVRVSLGVRPDPSAFDTAEEQARARLEEREGRAEALRRQIRDLEETLREATSLVTAARGELRAVQDSRKAEADRLQTWTRQAAILDEPLTGALPSDVQRLAEDLASARQETARARASDRYRKARATAAEARQRQDDAARRAEDLEGLATSVGTRLGELLSGTAAHGLTVVNGRLCAVDEAGAVHDFELRRSNGQRIRAALKVALRAYPGGIVPLEDRHWLALDPDAREELAAIAKELGLVVLTEEPGRGELRVEHVAGPLFEEAAA